MDILDSAVPRDGRKFPGDAVETFERCVAPVSAGCHRIRTMSPAAGNGAGPRPRGLS
jgi:hypothetical protein